MPPDPLTCTGLLVYSDRAEPLALLGTCAAFRRTTVALTAAHCVRGRSVGLLVVLMATAFAGATVSRMVQGPVRPSPTRVPWRVLQADINLATADLDGTFERLQASDADVVQEPTEQPYGLRDCAFRDPAGNLIRIQELR